MACEFLDIQFDLILLLDEVSELLFHLKINQNINEVNITNLQSIWIMGFIKFNRNIRKLELSHSKLMYGGYLDEISETV